MQYEYTVKNAKGRRAIDRLINRMAQDDWAMVEQSRRGALQWKPGSVDITFRRIKKERGYPKGSLGELLARKRRMESA